MPPTETRECAKGVKLEEQVKALRYDLVELKTDTNVDISEIKADIKEIKEKLLGRPSWNVLMLISGLFSAVGAMGMYIIMLIT